MGRSAASQFRSYVAGGLMPDRVPDPFPLKWNAHGPFARSVRVGLNPLAWFLVIATPHQVSQPCREVLGGDTCQTAKAHACSRVDRDGNRRAIPSMD